MIKKYKMPKTPKEKFIARIERAKKQAAADDYEEYKGAKELVETMKSFFETMLLQGDTEHSHPREAANNACIRHHFVQLGISFPLFKNDKGEEMITMKWDPDNAKDQTGLPNNVPDDFVMLHEDEED